MLMDIMMPEMDGYETMQVIRQNSFVPAAADHCLDRESHEGRSRKVSGGWRVRVSGEARQHGATVVGASYVASPVESVAGAFGGRDMMRAHDGKTRSTF